MSAIRRSTVLIALACLLYSQASAVLATQQDADLDEATILLFAPPPGKPALGKQRVRLDVLSGESLFRVQVYVDGQERCSFDSAPYECEIDLGQDNVEHLFEIVVVGADGVLGRASRETPRIRVDEELKLGLQQLYVTVLGGSGNSRTGLITGLPQASGTPAPPPSPSPSLKLTAEDFEVLDNGQSQTLVTFEGGDAPFSAAIVLDASQSMYGEHLTRAVSAARSFFRGMRPLDQASLLLVSDRLLFQTPFTSNTSSLAASLDDVEAAGGTALNDHLFLALKQLEAQQGRRVVVILSDGVDVDSVLDAKDVRWMAGRAGSVVYWIRLAAGGATNPEERKRMRSAWRTVEEHATEIEELEKLIFDTGGRIIPIRDVREAEGAFADILRELRSQFVLGYYPSADEDDGSWHDVEVRCRVRGCRVRTREGYYDY